MPEKAEQFSRKETKQRLAGLLQGAFAGPPTPLKDIPKRFGGIRSLSGKPKKRRKRGMKAA